MRGISLIQDFVEVQHLIRKHRPSRELGFGELLVGFGFADFEESLGIGGAGGVVLAQIGEAGGEDGEFVGFEWAAEDVLGDVGEWVWGCDGFLGEVASGFDELRVVHGDEGLQRRVRAVAADAAHFAAGGVEDVHVG